MEVTAVKNDVDVPFSSTRGLDVRSDGIYDKSDKKVIEFKAEPVAWTTNESSFAATFISSCKHHYDFLSGLLLSGKVIDYAVMVWDLKSYEQQSVVISTELLEGVEAMGFEDDGRLLVCGTKSVWVTPKSN